MPNPYQTNENHWHTLFSSTEVWLFPQICMKRILKNMGYIRIPHIIIQKLGRFNMTQRSRHPRAPCAKWIHIFGPFWAWPRTEGLDPPIEERKAGSRSRRWIVGKDTPSTYVDTKVVVFSESVFVVFFAAFFWGRKKKSSPPEIGLKIAKDHACKCQDCNSHIPQSWFFGESRRVDMVFLSLLRPKDLEQKFQKSPRWRKTMQGNFLDVGGLQVWQNLMEKPNKSSPRSSSNWTLKHRTELRRKVLRFGLQPHVVFVEDLNSSTKMNGWNIMKYDETWGNMMKHAEIAEIDEIINKHVQKRGGCQICHRTGNE